MRSAVTGKELEAAVVQKIDTELRKFGDATDLTDEGLLQHDSVPGSASTDVVLEGSDKKRQRIDVDLTAASEESEKKQQRGEVVVTTDTL